MIEKSDFLTEGLGLLKCGFGPFFLQTDKDSVFKRNFSSTNCLIRNKIAIFVLQNNKVNS